MLLAVNLTLIAFIALPLCAIALGVTVYFFLKTRESLKETMQAGQRPSYIRTQLQKEIPPRKNMLSIMEEKFARMKAKPAAEIKPAPVIRKQVEAEEGNLTENLRTTIAQQQKLLNSFLVRIEEVEEEGREVLVKQNNELEKEIVKLHSVIEKKDEEIEEALQQVSDAEKLTSRIDEVYQEFEQLQIKMQHLEKQANRSNNLAIELEDTKHSYEQVHKELMRKHEKLEEIMQENARMRQDMNTLEDKLADANLQRQQLQKKVQFLQDLNAEMQDISETNKKLQTEVRRIGELESMLNMMAEERDSLLRKKSDK